MNNPYSPPPIPSPTEQPQAVPITPGKREWKDAPMVVKGWAYFLTWFSIILIPFASFAAVVGEGTARNPALRIVEIIIYSLFWGVSIWHNRALKKGASYAWTTQVVLSILGLCGVPLGTVFNVYILSQWFKPETKRWFGKV